jgi:peptide/nickel transport system permease protein
MIPIISLWGLDMGQLLGGAAILTETVFNLQGVGQLAATAIGNLDVITIMVIVILTALAVVLLSAVVDILYAVLDPRIRLA